MSFTENFLKELEEKRKKLDSTEVTSPYSGRPTLLNPTEYTGNFLHALDYYKKVQNGEITTTQEDEPKKSKKRTWFQGGSFSDGYDFGDVTKAILGTAGEIVSNVGGGILEMGEGALDTLMYLGALQNAKYDGDKKLVEHYNRIYGYDFEAEEDPNVRFIKSDLYDGRKVMDTINPLKYAADLIGGDMEEDSLLGDRTDSLLQSGGQLLGTVALGSVGVPWWLTTGVTSFGGNVDEALNAGASLGEAGISALIGAGADILTEKISGGIKFGGKTLDAGLTSALSRKISNKFIRSLAKLGIDAFGEGMEEVVAENISTFGEWLTYRNDEELSELLWSEEAMDAKIEAFIGGAALGGGSNVVNAKKSAKKGVDPVSGLTASEESVVNKIYNDKVAEAEKNGKLSSKDKNKIYDDVVKALEKGDISTDVIEEVLGGETYKSYQDTVKSEDALRKEYDELGELKENDLTVKQRKRLNELEAKLEELKTTSERDFLQKKYKNEAYELAKGSKLEESYNERTRRGQAFTADVTKYNEKQRAIVQKAIDSGILNNTNKTHDFVDLVARIAGGKNIDFDFLNNAKLKESGFALDGVTVNGYFDVNTKSIGINLNSAKALNTVVGHEITHVLEGTKLYSELQKAVTEYAKTKGEYQSRYDALAELYKNIENADIDAELTADLVGDYLFTDAEFVNNLSANHRNVFQKIYDELKYLCKIATAGSKEARQLEKVKKTFEDAFRTETKNTAREGGTKYSLYLSEQDIPDYLKAGSRQNKNRQMRYEEGQRMIVSTDAEFDSFVKRSIEGSHNEMVAYGKVDDLLARQVKKISNSQIDIADAYLELLSDDIKHAYNEHYKAKETGDLDMTVDDLIFALKNVNQSEVVSARQYKDGAQRATLAIPTEDGMMILVELASKSAGALRLKTGWKITNEKFAQKYRGSTSATGSRSSTNTVSDDTTSNNSIPQNQKKSTQNTKNSLSTQNDDLGPIGNYNVYGEDVAIEGSLSDDYAPIAETPNSQTSVDSENGNVNRADTEDATALSTESSTENEAHNNVNRQYEIASDSKIEEDNIANGKSAITTLINQASSSNDPQTLTVKGAMYRTDIGSIDFVWGFPGKGQNFKKGYGISHIIAKRNLENGSGEQTVNKLVEVIAKATEVEVQKNTNNPDNDRIKLHHDGYTAVLSQKPQGNSWLLTGWENKKETASYAYGEGYDSSAATATMPTLTRHDRGNDTVSNNIIAPEPDSVNTSEETAGDVVSDDLGPIAQEPAVQEPTETESDAKTENSNLSVRELYEQKLSNHKNAFASLETDKSNSLSSFDEAIRKKLVEYNGLKDKNTKRANTLLQQIENLRLRRDNVQADYANRIAKQQARIEAFESKSFEEFENETLAVRRSELQGKTVESIKDKFNENELDFDEVLKHAKDLSTFSTVDNTPQRVMEKSLGYKEGGILADLTVNKVAQNETEGIKWLNSITDRKNGLLAQLVKDYGIKPGSKASAAAQMYAEGFYVDRNGDIIEYGDAELRVDFPDSTVRENIKKLAKDERVRQFYDETLDAINESRRRNGYPEIQKLDNYFLHFRAMEDTFSRLGLPFNPNDIRAKDLPTDLNGVTADLKPGQPYFASSKHREGKRTSFDLLGGLEKYATSAKNQIYHIDDIQTLRALRNYVADTYGQAKGLENLDTLTEEEVQEKIKEVYGSHLSTFAKFLNEEANVLAGKTALIDRGLEGVIGRRAMSFMDTVNRQVGSNMVGYNVSSALTNLIAPVQAFAKTNKADFIKGFAQTVSNRIKAVKGNGDTFAEESPVVIRRKGSDRFHRTAWQKVSDPGYALMGAVDNFSTEIIARAKYNELTRKGMDSETAHVETDKWVSRLMGDRSLGQMPQIYNSKMLGLVTKFQLEVRNQLDSQFYDTIQEAKASTADIENALERNAKKAAKVGSTFFTLAVGQHLFGKAFEAVAGYNPAFDIISVLIKALGLDDDEDSEDTVLDNIEQGFFELMGDMPYTSILEGGRIPISSALPIEELYKGTDQYGNEKSRWETVLEALPYYALPGGYGQFKKTKQGLGMFDEDLPVSGSYTDSGKLRFPVDDNLWKRVQAGLFGQYASENARDYFDNERKPLDEKQIQEFVDSGISIQDYWEYREGLSGLKTLAEKADYIYGLDIPIEAKNLFINNLSSRKEEIDLSGMGGFESFEEYDYAQSNPGKYAVSKAVASDLEEYKRYSSELGTIESDKDKDGKTVSGSRKKNVVNYINGLDLDYGQKIILYRSQYKTDNTYNYEIVDYLNGRDDISYDTMVAILKELGFKVDGNSVTWD